MYIRKMCTHCNGFSRGAIKVRSFNIIVHHTPGHSAGSVCFEIEGYHLFTGDTFILNKMWEIQIIITVIQLI